MNIYEIAKLSGVAPSTVSKVINNYSGVSEKTRKKVMKTIDENSFVSNMNARQLSMKKSNLVGILLPSDDRIDMDSAFHVKIINGFRRAISKKGYDVVFVSKNIHNKKVSYLEHCKYMNIAGVLVISYDGNDQNVLDVIESDLPVVSTHYLGNSSVCEIYSDDYNGTKMAIEHLIELGHRKIGYICGPNNNTCSAYDRLEGYKDTLKANGLEINNEWIKYSDYYKYEEGVRIMKQWLEEEVKMPTAIAVASDVLAFGAIKELKRKGYKVPEDISVIGFDDYEASRFLDPELTTIRQDITLIGTIAGDELIKNIDNMSSKEKIIVPVSLIERSSCKKLV